MSGHKRTHSGGQPDNPPLSMPVGTDPAKFPVKATGRPEKLSGLLSHTEVAYNDWEHHVAKRPLYYLDGIIAFMKMVRGRRAAFLKEDVLPGQSETCVAQAMTGVEKETEWTTQAFFDWKEGVAANQLRRMRDGKAVVFTKPVYAIVACEFALRALRPDVSPFWVYDYMRIIPAVYNIDRLNTDIVELVSKAANGPAQMRDIAGLYGMSVLHDLANGHCVTAMTAHDIADYVNNYVLTPAGREKIGPVRPKPGKKRLGLKEASPNEEVDLH